MRFSSYKIWWVNATKIAEELGLKMAGWTIVNTAMLGGVVKIFNWIRLNSLIEAIKSNWSGQVGELNAKAAKKAFEEAQTV
jgi:pyruvate ferredoxin oxidoreductase gamma subunit